MIASVREALLLAGVMLAGSAALHGAELPTDMLIQLPDEVQAGSLVRGRVAPGIQLRYRDRELRTTTDGRFAFGIEHDASGVARVELSLPSGAQHVAELPIRARSYPVQRVDGVPQSTVTPDPQQQQRVARDAQVVTAARQQDLALQGFTEDFRWPVAGRRTGVYGSSRILNGVPRAPHFGVDLAAPTGTPIRTAASGQVTLAEMLFLSGNTVVVDHGHGISTTYLHLDRIDVEVGEQLATGAVIGTVGATGRATGPHLCWRMNWFDVRLDAALAADDQ